jgi:restriction system protein
MYDAGRRHAMEDDYSELMRPLYERLALPKAAEVAAVESALMAQASAVAPEPAPSGVSALKDSDGDPETQLAGLHRQATAALKEQILAHIYAQDHTFFEQLIIDVLLAMGYGSRRRDLAKRLGRSHDGGIDGVISQDELGLDVILLQAKRLRPGMAVTGSQVRDFIGSLEAHHAQKGVFVTTGQFSAQARSFVGLISRRVVLINGQDLTALMVRHNIGVDVKESYVFKAISPGYFRSAHDGRAQGKRV